jgi:hypothetical protein
MNKEQREELHWQLEEDKITAKANIAQLMQEELIDEDGYPTEAALTIVRIWHWSDSKGWFEFIKSIWHLASWGWSEGEADHDYRKDEKVYQYHISTAGWSGNEAIIREMEQNDMMWHFNWVQSRRGGHYIFELRDYDE